MCFCSGLLKSKYTVSDIHEIVKHLYAKSVFDFIPLPGGVFSASRASIPGYNKVWIRDNIYIAHAHHVIGKRDVALRTVLGLLAFYEKHRFRFQAIIDQNQRPASPMDRPHVRFDGSAMAEINESWEHAQNDALGYLLWLACMLFSDVDMALEKPGLEQSVLDVLILFPLYFKAICFWQDEDSGHWEEEPKVEASSIGAVVAGLKQFRSLMLANLAKDYTWQYADHQVTVEMLDELISLGESALDKILPWECVAPSSKQRRYDAALLFLIYPLNVVSEAVADQIIADVRLNLEGEIGVRRYLFDSYWCQDFQKLPRPIQTSIHSDRTAWLREHTQSLSPGSEAQWCIFDPILSSIYGMRYQSSKRDAEDLKWQTTYLNRSLRQITAKPFLIPMGETGELREIIEVPADSCPELYYLMGSEYVPNVSTPLLWTQANLMVALEMMIRSLSLPCP